MLVVFSLVVIFVLLFVLEHVLVIVGVVDSLLLHHFLSLDLLLLDAVLVLVLQMLHFLLEHLDLSPVSLFHGLHISVKVFDPSLKLLNLSPGIVVKVMDHVFLHLKHIPVNFGLDQLFFELISLLLKSLSIVLHELIIGLDLVLGSLLLFLLATFLSSHFCNLFSKNLFIIKSS